MIVCFVEVSKSRSKPRHMDVKTDPRHCPSSISHRHNTSTSPPQQQTPDHLPYTPPKTLTKTRQHADQVRNTTSTKNTIAPIQTEQNRTADTTPNRVRTLTGKEIELDIESDYKVRTTTCPHRAERSEAKGSRPQRGKSKTRRSAANGFLGNTATALPRPRSSSNWPDR